MARRVGVVLVEDNDTFRETLELLLGLRGDIVVVGSVGSGAEAIDVCARLEPDVALVDFRMPGLDGVETTAGILRVSPRTRVVCLTASIRPDDVVLVLEAGAFACVTKDEELERIVAVIHQAAGSTGS